MKTTQKIFYVMVMVVLASACTEQELSQSFDSGYIGTYLNESKAPTGEFMIQVVNEENSANNVKVLPGFDVLLFSRNGKLATGKYTWAPHATLTDHPEFSILSIARHAGEVKVCGVPVDFVKLENVLSATFQITMEDEHLDPIDPSYVIYYHVSTPTETLSGHYRGTLRKIEYIGIRPMF